MRGSGEEVPEAEHGRNRFLSAGGSPESHEGCVEHHREKAAETQNKFFADKEEGKMLWNLPPPEQIFGGGRA